MRGDTFVTFVWKKLWLLIGALVLLVFLGVMMVRSENANRPEAIREKIESHLQMQDKSWKQLKSHPENWMPSIIAGTDEKAIQELTDLPFLFYLFKNDSLYFWSSNTAFPFQDLKHADPGGELVVLKNGYYVYYSTTFGYGNPVNRYELVALLPVKYKFPVRNNYLRDYFVADKRIPAEILIQFDKTRRNAAVRNLEGKEVFYLNVSSSIPADGLNGWLCLLLTLGIFTLVYAFLYEFCIYLKERTGKVWVGLLGIATVTLLSRLSVFHLSYPLNLSVFELFNPYWYASSNLFPSLGHVLITLLLTTGLIIYIRDHCFGTLRDFLLKHIHPWVLLPGGALVLAAFTLFNLKLVKSLVIDSSISFDVINFFSLNAYSLIGLVVVGLIFLNQFIFSSLVNELMNRAGKPRWLKYLLVVLAAIALVFLESEKYIFPQVFILMPWLVLLLVLIDLSFWKGKLEVFNFRLVYWLLFFAFTGTMMLYLYNNVRDENNRVNFAGKLARQIDPVAEYLLKELQERIPSDRLLKDYVRGFEDMNSPDEYISYSYLGGYLSKFEVKSYFFDAYRQPVNTFRTYENLNNIFGPFPNENVVQQGDSFSLNHIWTRTVLYSGVSDTLGYLFMEFMPRKNNGQAVYPELLVRYEDKEASHMRPNYNFAVYNSGVMVHQYGAYNFPYRLRGTQLKEQEKVSRGDYTELWYHERGSNVTVGIVNAKKGFFELITLFAYFFGLFLLMLMVVYIMTAITYSRFSWKRLVHTFNPGLTNRIHLSTIGLVFFSFVVVGITTILFFINRYERNQRQNLAHLLQVVNAYIDNSVGLNTGSVTHEVFDTIVGDRQFKTELYNIAKANQIDCNIYSSLGNLLYSTQPEIFEKGLQAEIVNPDALFAIRNRYQNFFLEPELIGNFTYQSAYAPIRDIEGNLLGVVNIPFYDSQNDLRQEISNIIVALININAFIFFLAGILALMVTRSITRSFTIITDRFKSFRLQGENQLLEWKYNDEIGVLVQEYNKMVHQVEEAAQRLAKSEREGAWREMARQVAHEIKNPLTPMKLSIQFLQKAIESGHGNIRELSDRVTNTLVEQIDHLSSIASEFSTFANLPKVNREVLLLQDALKAVIGMYHSNDQCLYEFVIPAEPVHVLGNKNHLIRIFTNLIQNAAQSVPDERRGHVVLRAQYNESVVVIAVQDNGTGISPEAESKLFTPNFTTKSSGTGLGLAMTRDMVEYSHGRIWYQTEEGSGTTFYVEFPLAEQA